MFNKYKSIRNMVYFILFGSVSMKYYTKSILLPSVRYCSCICFGIIDDDPSKLQLSKSKLYTDLYEFSNIYLICNNFICRCK